MVRGEVTSFSWSQVIGFPSLLIAPSATIITFRREPAFLVCLRRDKIINHYEYEVLFFSQNINFFCLIKAQTLPIFVILMVKTTKYFPIFKKKKN